MERIPVTLIVKAPNQQIEDQTIQCELSWTIKKLKDYLSEVYPTKPRTEEQKLIYSGQLLLDSVILKDILRRYEGQETHTVHLVCTPSREVYTKKSDMTSSSLRQQNSSKNCSTSGSSVSSPSTHLTSSSSSSSTNVLTCANDLRNRHQSVSDFQSGSLPSTSHSKYNEVPTTASSNLTTNTLNTGNVTIESLTEIPQMFNQQYAAQLAMFQHNYINYLNQYMQFYANQVQNLSQKRPTTPVTPNNENEPQQQRLQQPIEPAAARVLAEPAIPIPNVNVGAEMEDGIIDRDWLDWFYVLSRLTMLFSIVYFYSSPLRFIFVFVLGCTMYLYQIGFFRNHLENNNLNNNIPIAGENNNNNRHNNEADAALQRGAAPAVAAATGEDQNNENVQHNNVEIIPDRPTVLGVMWTFFTTFFASLIPEIPNAL